MRIKTINYIIMFSVLITLGTAARLTAQEQKEEKHKHHHYKLVDIEPFGGPNSSYFIPSPKGLVNNSGLAVGGPILPRPIPQAPCSRATLFSLTDLPGRTE